MTELVERPDTGPIQEPATSGPGSDARRSRRVRTTIFALSASLGLIVVLLIAVGVTSSKRSTPASPVHAISLVSPAYTPQAAVGTTDDYHCTLLDPHVTSDVNVVSSQFRPGSGEVHHAVLSLVPPSLAATARQADAATGGKGWTCFGAPSLPGASFAALLATPWLSVWAPGHGADTLPKGTGIPLPAGSMVIMQVHYNLLVGDQPVENSLALDTVPASMPLLPLHVNLVLAPPDLPCPAGVTSPLCDRSASLADQARRFGADAAQTVGLIERVCGHNPTDPPVGDTTTCTWPVASGGYIVRAQAHMHLLGQSFTMVLNPGTPEAKTVLDVPNYNFDYQKAYNLSTPIPVAAGDKLQVTCTYNPSLAQQLPILRKAPTHFVTWGDGSSDEMCIGLAWTSASIPNSHSSI
jgi:hypothetical protein